MTEDWLIDLFIVLNTSFSNISARSWRPALVVDEAGVPGKLYHLRCNEKQFIQKCIL